jgi:lipoprotein
MKTRQSFSALLLAFVAIFFAACGQDAGTDIERNRVKVRLALGDLVQREVRGLATAQEEQVLRLDVVFFNTGGTLQSLGAGSGKKVFHYDATSPKASDWVNGSVSSKTVYLDLQRTDVEGLKAVAMINLPSNIKTQLENGTITTLNQLQTAITQTITKVATTSITTPLVMVGDTDVPASLSTTTDNTINVDVKRVIAKLQVNVYYEWDKLVVPKVGATADEKSFFTYKDFGAKTQLFAQENITARVDGDPTEVPVPAVATPKMAELEAVYINEYNFSNRTTYPLATNPSPYILLKLPAIIGENNDLTRLFPPPAGGDFSKTPVYNYYKVVLPEQILRNCFYKVHARIVGPGAPTENGAPIIQFSLQVLPWSPAVTVPGA